MEFKLVPREDLGKAFEFKNKYVSKEEFEKFRAQYDEFPDLFLGCYKNNELIGLCHGFEREKGFVILQGIGIKPEYATKGLGSELLKHFEEQVRKRGANTVSVGSAEGYVERFYMKNGFKPSHFLAMVKKANLPADYREKGYDISRERDEGDEHLIYIKTGEYKPSRKEQIKTDLNAREVIFIFDKRV